MLISNKQIAIIGGGPGGLTLAKLLQLKGASLKVYERDINKDVRIQGGALDLHDDSGLAALKKAGLLEDFKTHYRPGADKIRITDNTGKIFYDQHTETSTKTFGDKNFRPEIDRGPLRDILLNSLEPGTVVWDSHIVSIEPIDNGWKIFFKNGDSTIADIIIGADGAHSKIRPYVTNIQPNWAGITMVEGSIKDAEQTSPNIHRLLKGGKIFAFGNEKTLIVSSKGDGSFGFAVSTKTAEHWAKESGIDFTDNKQVFAWFKKEFSAWDNSWDELFTSETTIFIPRPQYCMPLDQQWKAQSNITLLGDAAHWMPPFAGEGVNMAMRDALELSECLTNVNYADTQAAIAAYEKKMYKRFAKVGQGTLFNTHWMHQPTALSDMLKMFSSNIFTMSTFIGKMWFNVTLVPFLRKSAGLRPKQNAVLL